MEESKKSTFQKYIGLQLSSALCLLLAFVFLAIQAQPVMATAQIIDDFNSELQIVSTDSCNLTTSDDTATNANILGSERDVYVETFNSLSCGSTRTEVITGAGVTLLSMSNSAANHEGRVTVTYDGVDDDAATLDPTGLGSVDLTANSATGFAIDVVSTDLGAPVTFHVYSNATDFSTVNLTLSTSTAYFIPYTDFAIGATATNPADFTDVGAVQLIIDSTVTLGLDVDIDIFEATDRDFGDLPAAYNMVEIVDNGAFHTRGDIYLGSMFDADVNGVESADATGDDATTDDEDGITPNTPWANGAGGGSIEVTVGGGNGCLNGWLDWTRDNDFADAGERIITNQYVTAGTQTVTFDVPAAYFTGSGANFDVYSRFRLTRDKDGDTSCSDESELNTTSPHLYGVYDGEVEDHMIVLSPTAISLNTFATGESGSWPIWASLAALMVMATATYVHHRLNRRPVELPQQ